MSRPTHPRRIEDYPEDTETRWADCIETAEPAPGMSTPCQWWTGTRNGGGYGTLRVGRRNVLAHRLTWMIERGPIPAGLYVLHRCDVPRCVAVDHLWLGDHVDNMRDKRDKGRAAIKLEEADVLAIRAATDKPADLAARYGVTREMVNVIRRGEHWSHVGGARTHAGRSPPPPPAWKERAGVAETRAAMLALMPPEDRSGGSRRTPDASRPRYGATRRLAARLGVSCSMIALTWREGATVDILARWERTIRDGLKKD